MATSIEIDDAVKQRVENLANLRQKSADWVVREAIAQYVEREEARQNFKQEALASWADYQATGMHLTGDEVSAWLETWGTEANLEPPECHTWSSPSAQRLGSAWRGVAFSRLHGTGRLRGAQARSSTGNSDCCRRTRRLGGRSSMCRAGAS